VELLTLIRASSLTLAFVLSMFSKRAFIFFTTLSLVYPTTIFAYVLLATPATNPFDVAISTLIWALAKEPTPVLAGLVGLAGRIVGRIIRGSKQFKRRFSSEIDT